MTENLDTFSTALLCQQTGNPRHAEQLCNQLLQADPRHADAHHLLGVLAYQERQFDKAVSSIRKALELNSSVAAYHNNLGLSYAALGRTDLAAASYQNALRLAPELPDAHNGLGNALRNLGKLDEAVFHCREAIRLRPNFGDAHGNLALALAEQDKLDDAIVHYRQALALNPRDAKAHNNLGNALFLQGKSEEAITHYRQALHLRPGYVQAHSNLANALNHYGRFEDAVVHCREAIRLKPDFAQAHHNLGCASLNQGRMEQALASFQQALRIQPDLAEAQSNQLFCLNYYAPQIDLDTVFAEHCSWGRAQEAAVSRLRHANSPDPERRLRIGYVSPDFRFHPLARYLEPVLAHHDGRQVDVFCYAEVAKPDEVTCRLQSLVPQWRWTCRRTNAEVAAMVQSDQIDILIDLAGHTRKTRLSAFAQKPAPVQVTWLGYMNTTGLTTIDYRLTDDILDPPGQPVRDTEELVRLQGGMCCFAPPADAPAVSPLPALERGHVTFGTLCNMFKVNRRGIELWSRVLRAVPSSRLLMFHHTLTASAREDIRRHFQVCGVVPARLDLREGNCSPGYLGIYSEIDVSLDSYPCTGGVTTCESLWMGVPVLTLCGERPAGRNAAAILAKVGLMDWVAHTAEEYTALAVGLTKDLERLTTVRAGLRGEMAGTVCDGGKFTRGLEGAYRGMWRRWCGRQGAAPE